MVNLNFFEKMLGNILPDTVNLVTIGENASEAVLSSEKTIHPKNILQVQSVSKNHEIPKEENVDQENRASEFFAEIPGEETSPVEAEAQGVSSGDVSNCECADCCDCGDCSCDCGRW